jgi:endonuclease G
MKYSFILLLLVSVFSYSQDIVTLKHKAYTTDFNKSKRYPVKVEWWLTKAMVSCPIRIKRTDNFTPDPKLPQITNLQPSYNASGYDRGHMFPAADGSCDSVSMIESFYFSNMAPQTANLNRGDWKAVEELTRLDASKYDSVYIWAGSIGEIKKIGVVSVPSQCWKVIYIKKTKEWFAFIHNNDDSKPNGINDNKTTLAAIEKLTGYKFKAK